MAAYYNEVDPFAAQWLRNLIAAGHIAPGEVDERDIRDVSPTDLVRFDQCHFFAGIGGWSRALRLAGIPDDAPVWTGSCPCQPFSAAGSGGGFADERHLWPSWFHLVDVCRPAKIYGEQVASLDALEWFDLVCADLENAGYAVGIADIGAAGVGAPHIRQRLYFVADADGIGRTTGSEGCPADRYGNPSESSGGAFFMADASSRGFGTNGSTPGNAGHLDERGTARLMGHTLESGLERLARDGDGTPGREIAARSIAEASDPCGMADAQTSGRREKCSDGSGIGRGDCPQGITAGPLPSGANLGPATLNGFWRAADWLACRDGKWRPVEPGTFPLAHGIPGRVGRLRAYGNAIVPQVAAEFVRATL
jgi:DNA (cytosine-5)-methyltransferase 1